MVAGVRHLGGPSDYDFVVNSKFVFEGRSDIWKGATNALIECLKFPRPANHNPGLVLPDSDRVIVEQVIDGLNAPLIPHFSEPTPHQNNIFFDGHQTLLESTEVGKVLCGWYTTKLWHEPASARTALQRSTVATFDRPPLQPYPSSPKAVRAFVTTAISDLVSDRDSVRVRL